jgi:spermidine/putrescine ABC transporter ATP-binding subunit
MRGVDERSSIAVAGSAPSIGAGVSIHGLTKYYGLECAVDDLSIDVRPGEFVSLLGPSGSGKTTTMMAIAGFVDGYSGQIKISGRAIDDQPPNRRNVGVLFQHLALFPHMSVADNVAFPLHMRAMSRGEIARRVDSALRLVKMTGFEGRAPSQLSGGQQQRVALARAIVFNPPVLLLDEPLAALDRQLRESMQVELRALHRELGITVIHITHDQSEALTISDRIAVLDKGRLAQFDTPYELYSNPANEFVANFLGESVMLRGVIETVEGDRCAVRTNGGLLCRSRGKAPNDPKSPVTLMLRPERVLLGTEANGAANCFSGDVRSSVFAGDRLRYTIALSPSDWVTVSVPNRRMAPSLQPGERVLIGWGHDDAIVLTPS